MRNSEVDLSFLLGQRRSLLNFLAARFGFRAEIFASRVELLDVQFEALQQVGDISDYHKCPLTRSKAA
jgi:hypothetical protein